MTKDERVGEKHQVISVDNYWGWFSCTCGYQTRGNGASGYWRRRVNKHYKLIREYRAKIAEIEGEGK